MTSLLQDNTFSTTQNPSLPETCENKSEVWSIWPVNIKKKVNKGLTKKISLYSNSAGVRNGGDAYLHIHLLTAWNKAILVWCLSLSFSLYICIKKIYPSFVEVIREIFVSFPTHTVDGNLSS